MNVKRYEMTPLPCGGIEMGVNKWGEYVKFEDYEKLYDALYRIHIYPEDEPLWDDDRDDAAWEIVNIASSALNLKD